MTLVPGAYVWANEMPTSSQETVRAEVVRVGTSETRDVPGTDVRHEYQTLEARILEGMDTGRVVTIENDFLALQPGDTFFVIRYVNDVGGLTYTIQDVDRRGALVTLLVLFAGLVVLFGGWYGVRSLMALMGSFLVLLYVLVPGILAGWHPLVATFVIATGLLVGAITLTHGVNRESLIAIAGTVGAIFVTVWVAAWSVDFAHLSGFSAEESVFLNVATRGSLDLVGLLIGGIIIGTIGVLDDIAITQVSVVRELIAANRTYTRRDVFLRAMRVGREHVGAVVNTLALAYMGVSLPLVLLMYTAPMAGASQYNMEVFATEIVRTVVGSVGIVLAVPFVTLLAVRFLHNRPSSVSDMPEVQSSH